MIFRKAFMKFIIEKKKNKDNYQIIEWLNDGSFGPTLFKNIFQISLDTFSTILLNVNKD